MSSDITAPVPVMPLTPSMQIPILPLGTGRVSTIDAGEVEIDRAQLAEALELAVSEILEVSAFELCERVEAAPLADDAFTARLAFQGPPSGSLALWIERAEARALAVALLGADDPDDGLIGDTVAELANMIAGHVLSRVFGDHRIALDRAHLAVALTVPYQLVVAGEHGRIGIALEVTP